MLKKLCSSLLVKEEWNFLSENKPEVVMLGNGKTGITIWGKRRGQPRQECHPYVPTLQYSRMANFRNSILQQHLKVMRHCGLCEISPCGTFSKSHQTPCTNNVQNVWYYVRPRSWSDNVSHIKPAHVGHFQFHVRHVPHGLHIWRTLQKWQG